MEPAVAGRAPLLQPPRAARVLQDLRRPRHGLGGRRASLPPGLRRHGVLRPRDDGALPPLRRRQHGPQQALQAVLPRRRAGAAEVGRGRRGLLQELPGWEDA